MNTVERFIELFTGGDHAYGEWDIERGAITKHGSPQVSHYQAHLDGKLGLGLVPVKTNGLCQFAAIDIDIDTIDHRQLYSRIRERNLPLNVCRSKSGGAHLYLFTAVPGLPAGAVQSVLKKWAALLGYPQSEIFPKQTNVSKERIGSWINLPYFGSDSTTRYAVKADGSISLQEFLESAILYDPATSAANETQDAQLASMPPCLAAISQNGITEGSRNVVVFNLGVYFRKSKPTSWETELASHNYNRVSPPLDHRELQGIVSSVGRLRYQYTCDQEPFKSLCNKEACQKLPFGVGNKPWHEEGSYDDFTVGNLRKLSTDPPKYIVEVNGRDIVLTWEELLNFRNFKSKCGQVLDLMISGMKQPQWEMQIREMLSRKSNVDAPDDASMMGLVLDKFHEFLTLRERAQEREDLLRGLPVQSGDVVLFRAGDLRRYLQGFKLDKFEGSELFLALRKEGCEHARVRINGRLCTIWSYPLKDVNEQTQEFAAADFKKDLDEL